jgi:hypothetical protein
LNRAPSPFGVSLFFKKGLVLLPEANLGP